MLHVPCWAILVIIKSPLLFHTFLLQYLLLTLLPSLLAAGAPQVHSPKLLKIHLSSFFPVAYPNPLLPLLPIISIWFRFPTKPTSEVWSKTASSSYYYLKDDSSIITLNAVMALYSPGGLLNNYLICNIVLEVHVASAPSICNLFRPKSVAFLGWCSTQSRIWILAK